jgi:hypothetical protein
MSTIQGFSGVSVTLPTGFNGKDHTINATLEIPETDTTGFEDNNWGAGEPAGPVRLRGNVDARAKYNAATTAPLPSALMAATADLTAAQGSITLQFESGCTLAFTANITSVGMGRAGGEAMSLSRAFSSTGQVVMTWDETA